MAIVHPHELIVGGHAVCAEAAAGIIEAPTIPSVATRSPRRKNVALFRISKVPRRLGNFRMSGRLAVGDWRLCHDAPKSFPGPGSSQKFSIDAAIQLPTAILVEAKFLFALDLHDPRILDYDFDRAEAHAAYRLDDALQDFVARIGFGLDFAAVGQN